MSIFGWSYPPGCSGTPYDEQQAIDLADNRTLRGYGRTQHGLNGKDADLEPGGQIVVDHAWWHEDGTIDCEFHCYAVLCFDEEWSEEQADIATEIVCSAGMPGEWTSDDWFIRGPSVALRFDFAWNDDADEDANIAAACAALSDRIETHPDVVAFQAEATGLARALDEIGRADQ